MQDVPHEYIHRDRCELTRKEFYYIVSAQRDCGVKERWGNYNFPYLYMDGYKYWTMGDPFETTWILNRQKVFNEFDLLDWPIPRLYTESEMEIVSGTIMSNYECDLFECGFGNGDFVKYSGVSPNSYYGVDPSKKAVKLFRENNKGFYRRCSATSFEESVNKWSSFDGVVLALFGSPSYVMHQYLTKLSRSKKGYFLMFYNEGYVPEEFADMHSFRYKKSDIVSMFPKSFIYNQERFTIVSDKKINWKKPPLQYDIFSIR